MEVIVSAAVLLVVVLGVLAGLDSVTRTAASNQGRTVAATLAEKDLERLRGLRTADLNRLGSIETETRIVRVGDTRWEITSKAQWVTDADGEDISCALDGDRGSYLRITSSVLPASKPPGTDPVTMSSIVAPQPGKGTLTALVKGASAQPVVGMPVQAIGPSPATKPTNAAGCAVFNEAEAGSYKLRLDYSGWVDPDGNRLVEKTGTVSAGNLTTVEFIYDRAGSFPVSVVTRRYGAGADVADRSTGVIAAHTGVGIGYRAITTTSPGSSSFAFNSMFPFETPYEVYSGACTDANPATAIPDPNYFSSTRGQTAVAKVDPGAAGAQRTVLEPAIDVYATYNGAAVSNARVYVTPVTCAATELDFGLTDASGRIPSNTTAGPGVPFGRYDVCVQYTRRVSGTNRTWRVRWTDFANTNPAGTSLNAAFPATTGSC